MHQIKAKFTPLLTTLLLSTLLAACDNDTKTESTESIPPKDTSKEGNDILGHIFGNKDVSRHVAKRASEETGLGAGLLKKMLPVVATMVMGGLGKSLLGGGKSTSRQQSTGFLTQLLDRDRDGSMIDDVLGMAFKTFVSR